MESTNAKTSGALLPGDGAHVAYLELCADLMAYEAWRPRIQFEQARLELSLTLSVAPAMAPRFEAEFSRRCGFPLFMVKA